MDLLRAANRVFVAAAVDENAAKLMREKLPMATIQIGDAPILLAAADAAIVKSGTVTLEAALAQTPTVIFYRSSWMARQVIRWKEFYLPFFRPAQHLMRAICRAGIVKQRSIPPEFGDGGSAFTGK